MKRKRWDRKNYKIAIFISTIVMITLDKLFLFAPIVDIDWPDGWYPFLLFLLFLLLPTICCIGWALKNESRQGGILQAVGFVLIYGAVAFLWFAMWNPQASWEFPIPLSVIAAFYIAAIVLCFTFAAPPGRR